MACTKTKKKHKSLWIVLIILFTLLALLITWFLCITQISSTCVDNYKDINKMNKSFLKILIFKILILENKILMI